MRRFESAIRIEAGIVKDNIEMPVAQRAARWIKIERRDSLGYLVDGFSILGIEIQRIKPQRKRRCLKLTENIFVVEKMQIIIHEDVAGYIFSCRL